MKAEDILIGLNEGQVEAVKHFKGPALVTATAGSGKTSVLVKRAQYMILNGINPANILLTTFTRKAANEMKERIIATVGDKGKRITVGTYHSVCVKILQKYANKIDYIKMFTILQPSETDEILKQVAKEQLNSKEIAGIKTYISQCKRDCITPAMALRNAKSTNTVTFANCYEKYQQKLKEQQSMDFDDLLLNTVLLLENDLEVKKEVNKRWKFIFADEVQDSSKLDSRLIHLLAGKEQNIMMVGDDDQSIYSFRGGNVDIMINLKDTYPNLKMYNLGINYRSTSTIIEATQGLINNNKNKIQKEVSCGSNIKGNKIFLSSARNQEEEAYNVVGYIKTLHNQGIPYKEIAVLFRINSLSRILEEALMRAKIKYKLVGGTPFFCRAEIRDIFSYVRLTVNPYDMQAFKRSIGIPKRGIGDKTIFEIEQYMINNGIDNKTSVRNALDNYDEIPVNKNIKASLKAYNELLNDFDSKKIELSPLEFIKYIIEKINYVEYVKTAYKDNIDERINNILELYNVAAEYDNVEDLLIESSLYNDEDLEDEDAVQLMTIHKSKGLEFEAVIMTNMVEGTCPYYKAVTEKEIEEERRLMFVGCTRPKSFLFLTYPERQRVMHMTKKQKMSSFIKEINPKYICKI